jgi:hypothetical protein
MLRRSWQWLGTDTNYQALCAVFTILTFGAIVVFGILGLTKVADISVNLRELKADSIETNKVKLPGWEIGTD